MPKAISLVAGGQTVLPRSSPSSKHADIAADTIEASTIKGALKIVTKRNAFLYAHTDTYVFPFAGSEFEKLDEGRSAGKAAVGAIAGGLLLGPLGLIGGAALGGKKRHTYTMRRGDDALVLELSTSEVQEFTTLTSSTKALAFPPAKIKPTWVHENRWCVPCQAVRDVARPGFNHLPYGIFTVLSLGIFSVFWVGSWARSKSAAWTCTTCSAPC